MLSSRQAGQSTPHSRETQVLSLVLPEQQALLEHLQEHLEGSIRVWF
jgi:hypothetical protein